MKTSTRYPFTYSADYIRMLVMRTEEISESSGITFRSPVLSRGEAAHIVGKIAEIIGMDPTELKTKIADRYLQENPEG